MTCCDSPVCICGLSPEEATRRLLGALRASVAALDLWTDDEVLAFLRVGRTAFYDRLKDHRKASKAGVDLVTPWMMVGRVRRWHPDRIEDWLRGLEQWRGSRGQDGRRGGASAGGTPAGASGAKAPAPKPTRRSSGGRSSGAKSEGSRGSLLSIVKRQGCGR